MKIRKQAIEDVLTAMEIETHNVSWNTPPTNDVFSFIGNIRQFGTFIAFMTEATDQETALHLASTMVSRPTVSLGIEFSFPESKIVDDDEYDGFTGLDCG
jgi:hypothetical protein